MHRGSVAVHAVEVDEVKILTDGLGSELLSIREVSPVSAGAAGGDKSFKIVEDWTVAEVKFFLLAKRTRTQVRNISE